MPENKSPSRKSLFRFKGLASTLFFSFLLVSVGTLLVGSAITLYFDLQQQQKIIYNEQQSTAQSAAAFVKEFLNDKIRMLSEMVTLSNIINLPVSEQRIVLTRVLKTETAIRQLALYNSNEQIVANASQRSTLAFDEFSKHVNTSLLTKLEKFDRPSYISEAYLDTETNEPLITIAVPIRDNFGDFKGILVAEVNLKFMWELVSNLEVGEQGSAYVVDKKGYLLAFRDTARVLKRENLGTLKKVKNFLERVDQKYEKESSEEANVIVKGIYGTDVVSTYVQIADEPAWAVVVEVPAQEAYKDIIQEIIRSGMILIVSIVLIVVLSGLIARKITKPIVSLRNAAKEISAGKMAITIPVSSRDEVGELAEAFNEMSKQLNESYGALEQKVHEKTAELEHKVEESERMNKLMLGRELRMIELKRENEKLKQELEKNKSET